MSFSHSLIDTSTSTLLPYTVGTLWSLDNCIAMSLRNTSVRSYLSDNGTFLTQGKIVKERERKKGAAGTSGASLSLS